MTEQQAKDIGFEFFKRYYHDEFKTNRYKKGLIEMEFTYKENKLVTADITIQEINCLEVSEIELKQLDKILNITK